MDLHETFKLGKIYEPTNSAKRCDSKTLKFFKKLKVIYVNSYCVEFIIIELIHDKPEIFDSYSYLTYRKNHNVTFTISTKNQLKAFREVNSELNESYSIGF